MRRTGNLFDTILDRENLRLAFYKALRGKRASAEAREFGASLEDNLRRMAEGLLDESIALGVSRQFTIYDPKQRTIIAPCFPERVLHHAVMNVCEPVFDRWLIDDTYACRPGKGRVAALHRAQHFARRNPFFLKLDVRKYFDSVSHDVLLSRLHRLFKDTRLLRLIDRIVRSGCAGVGLPIGSLTSQHLANFYLGFLDRFVKEGLRRKGYVRYMDDMALWGGSARDLQQNLAAVKAFLCDELHLELRHEYINRAAHGMDWLGCRVYSTHAVLNRRSRRRFAAKLRLYEKMFLDGRLHDLELQQRAQALVAFARTEGVASCQFRRRVLEQMPVSGQGLQPRQSRR